MNLVRDDGHRGVLGMMGVTLELSRLRTANQLG
jgi:hypothetical protein